MNNKDVIEQNQIFYNAFNNKDIELMIGVWLNDPTSQCIHPGWDVLTGFKNIMTSWQNIFTTAQDLEIKLSHIDITTSENLAWVTCQENIFSIYSITLHSSSPMISADSCYPKYDKCGQSFLLNY